jgi:UDP-2-acetamido-2,6-beta-L-arabino-hexul-4-ose reductase
MLIKYNFSGGGMVRVGITGQLGFLGQHLYNHLGLFPDEFERIEFQRAWFDDFDLLKKFVGSCDVIVHLAALNRHADPKMVYQVNIDLVRKIVSALEDTQSSAHVVFSSSTQEENGNEYGNSKKDGRELLENWARKSGCKFTGLVIPNVFGPFGRPMYNSFIATFCDQLANNISPTIASDNDVKLIYVYDVVKKITEEIRSGLGNNLLHIEPTQQSKVSEILTKLQIFKEQYLDLGVIPELREMFDLNLFNTFRSYIKIKEHFPVKYTQHTDIRGAFVEVIKLNVGGQVSFSTTVPGITRGNHFHTRKIERFSVIKGEALIQLRKIGTKEVLSFELQGSNPGYVDMPIWYTHNIKNVGTEDLYTIFWINEFFYSEDSDTYFEEV